MGHGTADRLGRPTSRIVTTPAQSTTSAWRAPTRLRGTIVFQTAARPPDGRTTAGSFGGVAMTIEMDVRRSSRISLSGPMAFWWEPAGSPESVTYGKLDHVPPQGRLGLSQLGASEW